MLHLQTQLGNGSLESVIRLTTAFSTPAAPGFSFTPSSRPSSVTAMRSPGQTAAAPWSAPARIHLVNARNHLVGTEKNWWKYISCRARLAMRAFELSRPSRMLPFSWSLARVSSSPQRDPPSGCGTPPESGPPPPAPCPPRCRRKRTGSRVAVGAQVGVDGVGHPRSSRMVWNSRELMPPPSTVFRISVA
jgi:hypothetical protein